MNNALYSPFLIRVLVSSSEHDRDGGGTPVITDSEYLVNKRPLGNHNTGSKLLVGRLCENDITLWLGCMIMGRKHWFWQVSGAHAPPPPQSKQLCSLDAWRSRNADLREQHVPVVYSR